MTLSIIQITKTIHTGRILDSKDNVMSLGDAKKINDNQVHHVVITEVLEIGITQHSNARAVSDSRRESEIRQVFFPIPVEFVYIVVAAYNHPSADPTDQFFRKKKGSFEYSVVPSRKGDWQLRIKKLLDELDRVKSEKKGQTVWIGK